MIDRFSEDIDIALKREERFAISGTSNNQLAKVRRIARHYVIRELPEELESILQSMGVADFTIEPVTHMEKGNGSVESGATTHPSVILVRYKSILHDISDYIQPHVKIEISCLSMDEPVELKKMKSFISEAVPDAEDMYAEFRTVLPTRTFLEKIMLLHEEFQKENPRSKRMSRHLYDISRIMDTSFGRDAVEDHSLYNEIVNHRSTFNRLDYVDYSRHRRETIDFIPPSSIIDQYEDDYNAMLNNFMYERLGHMSFGSLIDKLKELKCRINGLSPKTL